METSSSMLKITYVGEKNVVAIVCAAAPDFDFGNLVEFLAAKSFSFLSASFAFKASSFHAEK